MALYPDPELPGRVHNPMWERLPQPVEKDGIEPDPVIRGYRQFRHKSYEGKLPAPSEIESYRQTCKAKCLEEAEGIKDVMWSKCMTNCANEVTEMVRNTSALQSSSRQPGQQSAV
eukprot:TRINITY_DN4893_c2_g1_i1.p1 TRINITY_DN4893_c2_g1~~TRINITY_DN4893_c2_g1_i1.p1  ORF type:complete len:115 (+),score=18.01 TRINITY_DN4893_c2_g1_i1:86-430(+)